MLPGVMPVGSSPPDETPPEGTGGAPGRSGPPPVLRELKLAWEHRYLVGSFVANDIRYRYTGGSIGLFWTVVNPLVELVTYTFVFNILLGVTFSAGEGTLHYSLFLFCGMVCWFSLAEGLTRATHSITDNAHLIKKVNFPAAVLPAHVVLSAGVNQFMRMIILALGVIFLGNGLSAHVLLVPAFMVVQAGFVLGLGFLAATAQVYFRDTGHWVNAVLPAWMFVSPIFYPPDAYPRKFQLLLQVNPVAHLVGVYQELILNQRFPDTRQILLTVIWSGLVLIVGYSVFAHHRRNFADLV
jgi:lipopolysaccharide transport system permease protein